MNNIALKLAGALLVGATFTSCMNTYDAYGNPVQSVDPGAATAAAAAAGVAGYAIGKNNGDRKVYNNNYYARPRPVHYHGRRW